MRTKQNARRQNATRRARRPLWLCRLRSLNRALASSRRVVDSTAEAVEQATDRAADCPVRTTRDIQRLAKRLRSAMRRLEQAALGFRETADAIGLDPEQLADVPRLVTEATGRWLLTALAIDDTSLQLCSLQESLLQDMLSGTIVPEREEPRRMPRIPVVPHLISARDFLLCSRKSAHDRIASIPERRRRTAWRPIADAPRRISRGRAPPSFSNCLL
jgi:hypothetical protein